MKKIIAAAAIFSILAAGFAGYKLGVNHAIKHQELYVVELPDRNEFGGFDEDDITVYTYLDGEYYEYGCTIG